MTGVEFTISLRFRSALPGRSPYDRNVETPASRPAFFPVKEEATHVTPGWDFRAAVCAVGAAQLEENSDEAIVFLLRTAIDQQTFNDLFQELFRRHHRQVTAWCCRITKDADRALDLTQEVFLRAFRRLYTFRGEARFSTWLYAIARNHCLNALKKWETEPVEGGGAMPAGLLGSDGTEVQRAMERDQSFQNMWRLIHETLTPMEARVMALHYGHGLPLAVITRQLMLSNQSGAKAYIVSARRKLNTVLRGGESQPGVTHSTNRSNSVRRAAC